ncbi:MAG: LysM peptidoglycan-binding domain-containing protein [Saprospiraceae bacterium]|nr:LysM peptidoglycan-binding domain-containing protein [Saprospiraceae bacterium]
MKKILSLLIVFSTFLGVFGQSNINLDALHSIKVDISPKNEIFYIHNLKKSETIYSLAKYFRIPVQDLMLINNISKNQPVALNQPIKIPLDPALIIPSTTQKSQTWKPVIYKVKKKETLYRIAKGYFHQNIQQLMARNNLTRLTINLGQELIVGWWAPSVSLPVVPQISNTIDTSMTVDPISIQDDSIILEKVETTINELTEVEEVIPVIKNLKGIAIWEKADPNDDFLFVLHKYARVGSVIKLQHPVTKLIVVANVVDNLPSGIYPSDVDIIISKAVALRLGALETRFQVDMTYYE